MWLRIPAEGLIAFKTWIGPLPRFLNGMVLPTRGMWFYRPETAEFAEEEKRCRLPFSVN